MSDMQRDELVSLLWCKPFPYGGAGAYMRPDANASHAMANAILAAGYRKPRTIPDEHFLCDQDYGTYAAEYPENTIVQAMDGSLWYRDDEGDWSHIGSGSAELRGPAIVIHEPEAEVGA